MPVKVRRLASRFVPPVFQEHPRWGTAVAVITFLWWIAGIPAEVSARIDVLARATSHPLVGRALGAAESGQLLSALGLPAWWQGAVWLGLPFLLMGVTAVLLGRREHRRWPVHIDEPHRWAEVPSEFYIRGTSDTFERNLIVQRWIEGDEWELIAGPVMGGGMGEPGRFEVRVSLPPGQHFLRVGDYGGLGLFGGDQVWVTVVESAVVDP